MTPTWLLDLLAAIMLVIAAASAARVVARPLLAGRPWRLVQSGTDVDLANAAMGIAMAGMFTSGLTTLPNVVWEVLFGLLTAWFAYRLATAGGPETGTVTSVTVAPDRDPAVPFR
ncbi:MAG: hypothetical protein JWM19_403 [Actinomycetia bacterium]|nr:hypothetical protein [Actinomycetes bacterium]